VIKQECKACDDPKTNHTADQEEQPQKRVAPKLFFFTRYRSRPRPHADEEVILAIAVKINSSSKKHDEPTFLRLMRRATASVEDLAQQGEYPQ
jgi:hypothetical protein